MPWAVPYLISLAISLAISAALAALQYLLRPKPGKPAVPTPADGKYNFKQAVPALPIVLGRVKKGGDYVFLEERNGTAYHVTVFAAHRIQGFVQHFLHDEPTTVVAAVVVAPEHFTQVGHRQDGVVGLVGGGPAVFIGERLGFNVETAWEIIVEAFPEIWTTSHRGDGLAQVVLQCATVSQENYLTVYPQQMPVLTSVGDGALLYDPRTDTTAYTRNLALFRLFHLTHPSGIKLSIDDIYLPDWIAAADVCDDLVINKQGASEARYWGGFWYRYDNDPVDVGFQIDEAADMVIYERADGKIGVHAGVLVEPDIIVTKDDIVSIKYDTNKRLSTNVLAVRGRFNDPGNFYNTTDAAIYGNPYEGASDNTERTKTLDNLVIQSHNLCQRLQKLAFIRANAARVNLIVFYDPLRPIGQLPYRRFIRIDYPDRGLNNALAEIVNRPKLSMQTLTYTFDVILVPDTLYDFDADTEEGELPPVAIAIPPLGVPMPVDLRVVMGSEDIAGGSPAVYAVATWRNISDALTYEFIYHPVGAPEVAQTIFSTAAVPTVKTGYLQDGITYHFKLRAWSGGAYTGTPSAFVETDVVSTATLTAPGAPTGFSTNLYFSTNDVLLAWTNPSSSNFYKVAIWRGTTNVFGSAQVLALSYGLPSALMQYVDEDLTPGTYYYWVQSFNASNIGATQVGPESETAT